MNMPQTTRREFLRQTAVAGAGLGLLGSRALAQGAGKATPPNIVVIFCDDLGYGDLGCFGEKVIRTPNVHRMAREGIKLTDFYVTAAVCTPSRAALLTGRYQTRMGLPAVLNQTATNGLPSSEVTIAEGLRGVGYATGCIGKWHLGCLPEHNPVRHGFDFFFGAPFSNDMKEYRLLRNEEVVEKDPDVNTLTERYTVEAVGFIRRSKGRPFFLYFPHTMPHVPLGVSEGFRGKSPRGLYGDVVQEIDWSVGEVLGCLQQEGLDNNTLVLFTSDNGPWLVKGKDGGSAGPLRAGKGTMYEGGIREPFVARWPGVIPAGAVSSEPCQTIDFLPTFFNLAGAKIPTDREMDGKDMMGVLKGTGKSPHDALYYWAGMNLGAMRAGNWKLHLPKTQRGSDKPAPAELYDLRADLAETTNLADKQPAVLQELLDKATKFHAALKATARMPPGMARPRQ